MILDNMIFKVVIVIAAAGVGMASYMWLHLPANNIIEEGCEDIIKAETGLEIDLSPTGLKQ